MTRGKLSTSPQDPERLRELTRRIGEELRRETATISDGMSAVIEASIGELADPEKLACLHASVANNVAVIVHLLAHTKDASDLPPLPDAHRYAEELAKDDVPESALRRAYHVGSNYLLAHVFDQVQEIDCAPHEQLPLYHHLAGWLYQYVDEITRGVIATYQEEKRSSHERAARTINTYVNRVLAGDDMPSREFVAATGYELEQVHVGCRLWIRDLADASPDAPALARLIAALRTAIGAESPHLVVVTGRGEADVWFGRGRDRATIEADTLVPVIDTHHGARIALGAPGRGADGFRRSRAQAHQAATIARVAGSPTSRVVSYADEGVPVIARLCDDLAQTRRWVRDVLGDLAHDSDNAARQRDTVRVFLESGTNYSATATQLMLHRNTVRYRLEKAEQQLGRGVSDTPLDTQLALALCRVLGAVVLASSAPRGGG